MTAEGIDEAIRAHLEWVQTLRRALDGKGRKNFNVARVGDDTACDMGKWLYGGKALEVVGKDFHERLTAIHATFHEIAAEAVVSLNNGDPPEVTAALIAGLEDLSKSIVSFFEFVNRQLDDGPSDYRTIGK